MSRIRIMLLATGLSVAAILLASATRAQAPGDPSGPGGSGGGPGPGEGSSLSLVVTPAVQDELELTKGQKTEIDKLKSGVDKKSRAILATLPPRPKRNNDNDSGFGEPGGHFGAYGLVSRTPRFQAAQEQLEEIEGQADTALGRILKPPQAKRLSQIKLQSQFKRQGLSIIASSDELVSKLNLSGEQIAQIREISREGRQRAGDARHRIDPKNPPPDPSLFKKPDGSLDFQAWQDARNGSAAKLQRGETAKKVEKIRDQLDQQITKVLTKTQLSNFMKLLGAQFDLAKLAG
jgi:hypothetical protein